MKNLRLFGLAFIFIMFFSCDKSEELLNSGMSAEIDGVKWESLTRVTTMNEEKITITGTSSNKKIITITIWDVTTGTYNVSTSTSSGCQAVYKESADASIEDTYVSASGFTKVTEINTTEKRISGTFEFKLARGLNDILQLENGVFTNLKYNLVNED